MTGRLYKVDSRSVALGDFRPSFLIGGVLAWNVICIGGVIANGGFGKIRTNSAAVLFALAFGIIALAAFGSIASSRIRSLVLEPTVQLPAIRRHLEFLGLIGLTPTILVVIIGVYTLVRG